MHNMHTVTNTFQRLPEYPHVTSWAAQLTTLRLEYGLLLSFEL
jgi:hypothetical protein